MGIEAIERFGPSGYVEAEIVGGQQKVTITTLAGYQPPSFRNDPKPGRASWIVKPKYVKQRFRVTRENGKFQTFYDYRDALDAALRSATHRR